MRKYIIAVSAVVLVIAVLYHLYYSAGIYIDLGNEKEIRCFVKTEGKEILLDSGSGFEPFEIRGVDLGSGMPGEWSTDYRISREMYLRWFGLMQEMGANTVRVYSIQQDTFYNAFFEYNTAREREGLAPLYLLHGVWVSDYLMFSHHDFFSEDVYRNFEQGCLAMVDIIHGKRDMTLGRMASSGSGVYRKDVSRWVIGYILGVEWESDIVVYTNGIREGMEPYRGKYLYSGENATPFEIGLTMIGDRVIEHESRRYGGQRLLSFSNWPETDPFKYSTAVTYFWKKLGAVDVEQVRASEAFQSGVFASYHVYPYFPDYLQSYEQEKQMEEEVFREMERLITYKRLDYMLSRWNVPSVSDYVKEEDYTDALGRFNTCRAYLFALNRYHTIPVVISEFGVSTGRGIAHVDENTGRNQGHMTEKEQGQALVECYRDIRDAGCAGCCLFAWQDEWFKRSWNTLYTVDLRRTPYWSDYQTNEQFFGVLTFDPGKETSVSYVDGDVSEWTDRDLVLKNRDLSLSVKYDEKFVYFMVQKPGFDPDRDTIYIPIDTTPKSGSNYCANEDLCFDTDADFLLVIRGYEDSRLLVQKRYESIRSTFSMPVYLENAYYKDNIPPRDSPEFVPIVQILKSEKDLYISESRKTEIPSMVFVTGDLRYGNANPESPDFDSLADYIFSGDFIEIRIPWQLLNFADPSRMEIHDDYYEHYGVDYLRISSVNVGVSDGKDERRIPSAPFPLKGWGNTVTYHERLKDGYFRMQEIWAGAERP